VGQTRRDPRLMPWLPELFTAPALARIWEDERRRRLELVPFFAGVMTGETGALVESFAGAPELHHPARGRVKGVAAFERFVSEMRTWLAEHSATAEDVDFVLTPGRGVEELILHLDTDNGRIELPVAVASDHDERGRIVEQRIYFSSWPLTGGHAIRPPVLQPSPGLDEPDVVGDYQRALAAGDADAVMAAFEPDASVREPAGRDYTHHGVDALRALYERFFSNGGGIPLEHCAVTDDGRGCALEYNVVAWGRATLPPQAGLAVYVRGDSGRLAAARIYDDADPPLTR
jgi:SnoaL-like domain